MGQQDERDEVEEDDLETITITGVLPYGMFDTIIVFEGVDVNGLGVRIGVDHRPARELIKVLDHGNEAEVAVEPWQVIGRYDPNYNTKVDAWFQSSSEREADRAAGRE